MTQSDVTPADLTASITINASPAQVWALVSDLPRMSEFSPQVVKTVVLGRAKKGARFVNLNTKHRRLFWPTTGKIVRFTPHSDFAFRITENRTIWSFRLEPTADSGTLVTQRREAPDGISVLSKGLTKSVLGGQEPFTAELIKGMNQTLARIKAAAER
ncbi:MAG: SRPBCC family protein [Nocardioides sp.]